MTDYVILQDEELVAAWRGGDERAAEMLIERYKNMVRMKSRPYFLIGADREDLVQEGMIGLYKAVRDYSSGHEMSFRSFADMCVHRQIITAIKRATRKKHTPLNTYVSIYRNEDEERERPLIDTMQTVRTENPEELFISRESLEGMRGMLEDMLSPLEKRVLDLFLDGRSYQEISEIIGRGTKTVDNALQRIKKKLEVYLDKNR
jgi:RNA polymerase sporulation-specific sigma factor